MKYSVYLSLLIAFAAFAAPALKEKPPPKIVVPGAYEMYWGGSRIDCNLYENESQDNCDRVYVGFWEYDPYKKQLSFWECRHLERPLVVKHYVWSIEVVEEWIVGNPVEFYIDGAQQSAQGPEIKLRKKPE